MHIFALLLCLFIVTCKRNAEGVSLKTHILFLIVFSLRYLNLFFCTQFAYLVALKVGFWIATATIVTICFARKGLRDKKDTCSTWSLLVPTTIVTIVVAEYRSVVEVCWIFSQHLEGFAMIPQYVYSYRDSANTRRDVLIYVLCLGGYRMLYGMNWIYKYFYGFVDLSSWISGVLNIVFFTDFLVFKVCGGSPLSRCVLAVDDGVREARHYARTVACEALQRRKLPRHLLIGCPQTPPGMAYGRTTDLGLELGSETHMLGRRARSPV